MQHLGSQMLLWNSGSSIWIMVCQFHLPFVFAFIDGSCSFLLRSFSHRVCDRCREVQKPAPARGRKPLSAIASEDTGPICCLCPVEGGALKPTDNHKWAHVPCCLWNPGLTFKDPLTMNLVVGVPAVLARVRFVCLIFFRAVRNRGKEMHTVLSTQLDSFAFANIRCSCDPFG